ncbi:amino acid adenylation domain-containing protein [Neorhizobium huautlense]|uniref:Amino acid adenylation domain-containing protein n=1 Tax=Neorhizobium huautlense TaxID=67774 RepID=A0ABT9Q0N3_9HYPH|nr:class I adenylate-forming enzyme family protein [Neorhizobium huautlense]MDP9840296.1 amino acid adenylation domain-containing protein [Neorhizobium huautlense]
MRIETLIADNIAHRPDKTAVVAGDMRLTYRELDRQSSRLAAALQKHGIRPGDRIVFLLDNGSEAVVCFFSAWKAGGVACPLHPTIKSEKLAEIFRSIEPAAIIAQGRLLPIVDAACAVYGQPTTVIGVQTGAADSNAPSFEDLIAAEADFAPPAGLSENDLALLIHTSGSTGRPKGVMLSHANIAAACTSITGYLENTEKDVVLSVLPLSHGYGITQMVTMAMVGGTLVLEKSFAFPRVVLARLQSEDVTGFPLVPAMAALFAGMPDLSAETLPHLRYMTNAAAGMPPTTTQRLQTCLPQTALYLMYGQTECLRTTYLPPQEMPRRPLSVGHAIPGTSVSIVDDNGLPVAPGETGELVVEGPHVTRGYWRDDVATAAALRPGPNGMRLHTGDLFRADEEGFLYFVSRRDDIIKTRGEKVSPQEVERVLYALPGVLEAAVEGVDDAVFGQVIKAHVAVDPDAGLTERLILRHCAAHLEDFMIPKLVEFHDALPKTATGKIRLNAETAAEAKKNEESRIA